MPSNLVLKWLLFYQIMREWNAKPCYCAFMRISVFKCRTGFTLQLRDYIHSSLSKSGYLYFLIVSAVCRDVRNIWIMRVGFLKLDN